MMRPRLIRGFTPLEIPFKQRNRAKFLTGFSLIEVMIVIAIFSAVIGVIFAVMQASHRTREIGEIRIRLYRECKKAIDAMSNELEESNKDRVTINDNTGVGGSDIIIFQVSLVDSATLAENWGADGTIDDYIRYYLDSDNKLYRRVCNNQACSDIIRSTQIKANYIKDLQFTATDGCVEISVEAEKYYSLPYRPEPVESRLTSKVYLRN